MSDMTDTTSELLDTREAAEYLGLAPVTLKLYRAQGRGPRYVRPERNPRWIRYRRADLDDYRADQDAAVHTFATRAVAVAAALGNLPDADLDAMFSQLLRAEAADRKADRPATANFYQALVLFMLAEFARRDRKPAYVRPARKLGRDVTSKHGPSATAKHAGHVFSLN